MSRLGVIGDILSLLVLILLTIFAIPAFYAAYRKARARSEFYGSFDEWLDQMFDC